MQPTSALAKTQPARPETATACAQPTTEPFTGDRHLIFDQADWVEVLDLGPYNDTLGRSRWFLVFSRRVLFPAPDGFACDPRGLMWGEEIVAYDCDADGYVSDWDTRLEFRAHSYPAAVRKLRVSLINLLTSWVPAPTND